MDIYMATNIDPIAAGVSALAVSTRILARLIEKGVITETEGVTIATDAINMTSNDPTQQQQVRHAIKAALPNFPV